MTEETKIRRERGEDEETEKEKRSGVRKREKDESVKESSVYLYLMSYGLRL